MANKIAAEAASMLKAYSVTTTYEYNIGRCYITIKLPSTIARNVKPTVIEVNDAKVVIANQHSDEEYSIYISDPKVFEKSQTYIGMLVVTAQKSYGKYTELMGEYVSDLNKGMTVRDAVRSRKKK